MKIMSLNSIVCAAFLLVHLGAENYSIYGQPITFEKKYDFGHNEAGTDLVQTKDGGYFLVGGQTIAINYTNMLMMKTDDHGNLEWHNIIGSGGSANEGGAWGVDKIVNVGDSVNYIGGETTVGTSGPADRAYFLSKLNSAGDTVWTRTYNPGTGAEAFLDFCQARSGGFLLAGYSSSYDDGYFVRTDFNGDTLWTRTWRGPYGVADINAVIPTKDGGFAATGPTENEYGSPYFDMYLLKMDSLGHEEWVKLYKGHDTKKGSTYGNDLVQMPDSSFVIGGLATTYLESKDIYKWDAFLLRTSGKGDSLWSYKYGEDKEDNIRSILVNDDKITAVGSKYKDSYDVLLLQFTDNGKLIWNRSYGGNETDHPESIIGDNKNGIAILGYTDSDCDGCVYFIKTDSMGCVEPGCGTTGIDQQRESDKAAVKVYPNPASDKIFFTTNNSELRNLHLSLLDLTGRMVLRQSLPMNGNDGQTHQLAVGQLPRGMYVLQVEDEASGYSQDIKILLQ